MEVIEVMLNGDDSIGPATTVYENARFYATIFLIFLFNHCHEPSDFLVDTI